MKDKVFSFLIIICFFITPLFAQRSSPAPVRDRQCIDENWRFALGHAYDTKKDFNHGSGYFSYFAKTGYGDGAAAQDFDDRSWRTLDLPHDWAVELPFDSTCGFSHGFRAMGRNFPQNSVGWYRKNIDISPSDSGKRIYIEFEGVFRNSVVWINGFYLGTQHSGYLGFCYDITDYVNYGGKNVISVRVDATMEEGWFYEGAGIYRHTWLTKLSPLHVDFDGTFITSEIKGNAALLTSRTTIKNEESAKVDFTINEYVINNEGDTIATHKSTGLSLDANKLQEFRSQITVKDPRLWSPESPYLHKLITVITANGKAVDNYETTFGIRTVRFDPNEGLFINEKPIKLKGTNNHQDHAGIGAALPDAMQEFRIKRLMDFGCNAIRTSHNPPTPSFLDACDRTGMLILDENRLLEANEENYQYIEHFMKRDRNHPSVFIWSLGNEEWAVEGDIKGIRLTKTLEKYAHQFDSTRAFTVATDAGWETGIGTAVQVIGYNYKRQGNIDKHHETYPWQCSLGTEESNTTGTRGIYRTDDANAHMAPYTMPEGGTESGWQFYASRPFLCGLFYWTGFDYRGEMNPYEWPAVSSQYGIIDVCGFPKDIAFYLKSWWTKTPVLHIQPDWEANTEIGKNATVTVYSNCEQVGLFLNGKDLGKKDMPVNGHLEWTVPYEPGTLLAKGYAHGSQILETKLEPEGKPTALQLIPDRPVINADGTDVSVITVQAVDANGKFVMNDSSKISFTLTGPGKIICVGNGDPSSHEPDRYFESVTRSEISPLKECVVDNLSNRPEVSDNVDDSAWRDAFPKTKPENWSTYVDSLIVVRGTFTLDAFTDATVITYLGKSIVENQSVYINGHLVAAEVKRDAPGQAYVLDHSYLKPGKNIFAVTGKRFRKMRKWDEPNTDPGLFQIINPAAPWERHLFRGMAQIIVQSTKNAGSILLKASAGSFRPAEVTITTKATAK